MLTIEICLIVIALCCLAGVLQSFFFHAQIAAAHEEAMEHQDALYDHMVERDQLDTRFQELHQWGLKLNEVQKELDEKAKFYLVPEKVEGLKKPSKKSQKVEKLK
jgi:hypothetical protein